MKLRNIFIFLTLLLQGLSPSIPAFASEEAENYGYSPENPIKVGAFENGTKPRFNKNHRKFLSALRGPNGEDIEYKRLGSCCSTKSEKAVYGDSVLLDRYELKYYGVAKPLIIYINMYDFEKPLLPIGLSWAK